MPGWYQTAKASQFMAIGEFATDMSPFRDFHRAVGSFVLPYLFPSDPITVEWKSIPLQPAVQARPALARALSIPGSTASHNSRVSRHCLEV